MDAWRFNEGAGEDYEVFSQSRESSSRMCDVSKNPTFTFLPPNHLAIALESALEYDQTWIFGVEHCKITVLSEEKPRSISCLDREVKSGRSSAAVTEAFAIASWWEAIITFGGWWGGGRVRVSNIVCM